MTLVMIATTITTIPIVMVVVVEGGERRGGGGVIVMVNGATMTIGVDSDDVEADIVIVVLGGAFHVVMK